MTPAARPLATFTLLTYNQQGYAAEAVRSALAQDYSPLEIVISDDGSSDDTLAVIERTLESYSGPHQVRVLTSEINRGLASNLNRAFGAARGEFIVTGAGDDIAFPNKASALVAPMLTNPRIVGVHSAVMQIDQAGRVLGKRRPPFTDGLSSLEAIVERSLALAGQSHAFRRLVHEHFGPFNEDLTHEGKALAFRECALGAIHYLDEPFTYYRIGSGVSTYGGDDIDRLTLLEPRKIARWKLSSIAQNEADAARIPGIDPGLRAAISQRKAFLTRLAEVNSRPLAFRALLETLPHPREFSEAARAFLRVNSPPRTRRLYAKWLLKNQRRASPPAPQD